MKWLFRRNRKEAEAREDQRRAGRELRESIERARSNRNEIMDGYLHDLAKIIGGKHGLGK